MTANQIPHQTNGQLAQDVLTLATAKGIKLVTAESCTGGLVAGTLTEPAGSSSAFWGGIVAYANDMKTTLLKVHPETLQSHGAVSTQTASEMAKGAVDNTPADLSVSITGIAGPGGGTAEKPVGTVEFATFLKGDTMAATSSMYFAGDRSTIRAQAVGHALALLKARLEKI